MDRLGGYDIVVIGAGVIGASAAFFARRNGASVAFLDKGLPGQEGSGRNAGGVRQQGRMPAELPLARHSVGWWERLRDEFGGRFEYVQNGNMYLALTEQEAEILRAASERQARTGLPVRYLTAPEVKELSPALSDRILGASYCETDGQANPILATRFIVRLAQQEGATLYARTRAIGIEMTGGRPSAVVTDRGRIECRALILAAGAWTPELLRTIGIHIPLIARRTQVFVTTPLPALLPQFVSGNTIYIRQALSGNVFVGGGGGWEEFGFGKETSFHSLHRFAARGMDLLPALATTSILRSWAGTLDIGPDGGPMIGSIPGTEGLILAVGFAGHGFALGPGTGNVTARLALGMDPGVDISGLDPGRFPPDLDFARIYRKVAEPAP